MIDITGIELGPDSCVLVRAGSDPSRTTVTAARAVTPGEWSADHEAIVGLLRSAKRSNRLSSHARVVAWGLPESGAPADLTHLPELGPLVAAGFEIESIVSPVRALADLVRSREAASDEGIAALSLNTHGAAIAIVSRGQVVASRVFDWPLGRPFSGAYSEELDRYLLVSQIAPELRHLIDLVRPVHGVTVTSVVACGNLPNLRSLSMLLIEEMDLEVETLDSVELLDAQGAGRLADLVPTLQLAALAAMPRDGEHSADASGHSSGGPEFPSARSLDGHSGPRVADRPRSGSALVQLVAAAALLLLTTWSVFAVSGSSPATPVFPSGLEVVSAQVPAVPELATEGTIGRVEGRGSPAAGRDSERAVDTSQGVAGHEAVRTEHQQSRPATGDPRPAAVLPTISGVMIAGDHRIAIVGDRIVSVGDYVGPYKIASIDRDQVVLMDQAGRSVQMAIRIRKPPPPGYP